MKKGITLRRKGALERLEAAYKEFKAAGEDKASWTTTRHGRVITHKARSYQAECARMEKEIAILKDKISRAIN